MNRCKSKTFAKDSDYENVNNFITENIELENIELTSAPDGFDILTQLKHKYIVTITAVDYKKEEV